MRDMSPLLVHLAREGVEVRFLPHLDGTAPLGGIRIELHQTDDDGTVYQAIRLLPYARLAGARADVLMLETEHAARDLGINLTPPRYRRDDPEEG